MPATAEPKATASSAPAPSPSPRALKPGDHVFLVDGSSYIFRAYFAMFKAAQARGKSFTRSDGLPVGAVMTFCNMLWKLLREGIGGVKPSHIAVVFDHSAKSFRNEIYADYKGHRPDAPDELKPQFPLMREAVRAFGLIPVEQKGFEADDLIATYVRFALAAKADVTIVAGDKDLMQLIRPGIIMYDPMPGNERRIGPEEVVAKFGVPPEKVTDVQALIGDPTDNVPGVPGIGVKTAAQLIGEYGDLETLLARAGEIKQEKRRQLLQEHAETARISKQLVLLDDQVELECPLDRLCLDGAACLEGGDPRGLVAFLKAMEFTTLTKRVVEAFDLDPRAIDPAPRLRAKTAAPPEDGSLFPADELAPAAQAAKSDDYAHPARSPLNKGTARGTVSGAAPLLTPAALVEARKAEIAAQRIDRAAYRSLHNAAELDAWINRAIDIGTVAVDFTTTSTDPMIAEIVGFSLALGP